MTCPRCGSPAPGDRCEACASGTPPGPRRRKRLPLRGLSGANYASSWKVTVLAVLGAVAVTGFVFSFLSTSADERLKKQGYFDSEVTLPPGKPFGYILIVARSTSYKFDVTPLEGSAIMAVGRVDDGDTDQMSDRDVAAALENAVSVEAGRTGTQTGDLTRGRYLWVVSNPSKDRPLQVKIKFG